MSFEPRGHTVQVAERALVAEDTFAYLERIPASFAVTRGAQHTLVFANAAFRSLALAGTPALPGVRITHIFAERDGKALLGVLDRVRRTGIVARDHYVGSAGEEAAAWCCTIWPAIDGDGTAEHLVIELRPAARVEHTLALQREVSERMLLGAMRERDAAGVADVSRREAAFLATEGRRLADSLDESTTLDAMARMSLPKLGSWSVLDIIGDDQTVRRLAIVHPDHAKQDLVRELEDRPSTTLEDSFGLPAMLRSAKTTLVADIFDRARLGAPRDPETLRILSEIGVGPLLTVPLVIREKLAGAVTFVGARGKAFSPQEVELAEDLAMRSAMALDRARLYGEAIELKKEAELANLAKSAFLGTMSHELRTPLNAIGGYLELIEMGLRGPVTDQQHTDLARIRASQLHLAGLVEDLLNFTKLGSGQLTFDLSEVIARDAIGASVALIEPLMSQKQLVYEDTACDSAIRVRADVEKLKQILMNLLSNAIKFTAPGGRIATECASTDDAVRISVTDTGVGISAHMLESIFDPFVQVRSGLAGHDRGVGLGLSISRGLARAMHGDVTVESALGQGTRFTLTLPRA